MTEIWKSVAGWPAYEVSNLGRVRSIDRIVPNGRGTQILCKGRMLTPSPNYLGYLKVSFRSGKKVHATMAVHRLVAAAFLSNPDKKPYVNHLDCNTSNARVDNLEWCTQAENLAHANRLGRMRWDQQKGRRSPRAALTDDQAEQLRARYAAGGISLESIGRQYGISKRSAGRIVHREHYADLQPISAAPNQGENHVG